MGAELDPEADTTSEAPKPVCSALSRIRPGMTAASDVALGGCEGKIGRDCWCGWFGFRQSRCKLRVPPDDRVFRVMQEVKIPPCASLLIMLFFPVHSSVIGCRSFQIYPSILSKGENGHREF